MKIFTFMMAFIIFFAGFVPCADGAVVNENHSAQIATNHQPSAPLDADFCSPFCICSCCGSFVFTPTLYPIVEIKPCYNNKKEAFLRADISSISLPIWQPPQLLS